MNIFGNYAMDSLKCIGATNNNLKTRRMSKSNSMLEIMATTDLLYHNVTNPLQNARVKKLGLDHVRV